VIEATDDRDFWEVWADNRQVDAPPAPAAGEVPSEPAPASESGSREAAEPGVVRLYLNLGRRDGASAEEIERFIVDRGVSFRRVQVRNSQTYVFVDEGAVEAAVAALHGARHGERDLVCERARR
jgi:hypothetical protein